MSSSSMMCEVECTCCRWIAISVIPLSLIFHFPEVRAGEQKFVRVDEMLLDLDAIGVVRCSRSRFTSQAASSFSIYSSKPWTNTILPVTFDAAV
jgi:hypothetical protein